MQAVPASLTLISDNDTIVIRPPSATAGDPIVCKEWDLGAPGDRAAMVDRPGADGSIDRTMFSGPRNVSFDLTVLGDDDGSPYAYVERLAAMTYPGIRPRVRITRNTPEATGQTWEMELRGNPYSLSYGRAAAAKLDMRLQFTAPTGYLLGDWQGLQSPQAVTGTAGFSAPFFFPLDTGTTGTSPALAAIVGGSVPISPVLYIYGPVTSPEIRTDEGERFKFAGLTLDSGQFVQIDMGAATVRLMASADASVYHLVDFSVSTFWRWLPGTHNVRYLGTSGSVAVQWRDRRFSI